MELLTPLVTPFDDGDVDTEALAHLVEHLLDAGVTGLVPCGTTGEMAALTDAERRRVIETTVEAAGDAPVMAGVGGTAVADVRENVRAAAAAGADSALVVAPYYGGQATAEGNRAFFEAVAADAPLPLYLYNIPAAAGQSIPVETVAALADHDGVAGIKDSSGNLTYLDKVLAATPADFPLYQGWDANFVPALAMGATGGINALTHVLAPAFREATAAVEAGDLADARAIQLETIDAAFGPCEEYGFAPTLKAMLAEQGVIPSAEVRPPLVPVPESEREALVAALE